MKLVSAQGVPVSSGNGHNASVEVETVGQQETDFTKHLLKIVKPYAGTTNVNIGCGIAGMLPGWVNIDRRPGPGGVPFDLEACVHPMVQLPSAVNDATTICRTGEGSVDCVLASHILEHITNLIPLMREIHRVLRPGGHLVACTPHAGSDDAWEDPTHVRAFTERSWQYFDKRFYQYQTGHGSYNSPIDFSFDVVRVDIVPNESAWNMLNAQKIFGEARQVLFREMVRLQRNMVGELIAVLKKVE